MEIGIRLPAWGCILVQAFGFFGFGFSDLRISGPELRASGVWGLPIGPKVVPFWGSYLEFYKVIPKRNYFGAHG